MVSIAIHIIFTLVLGVTMQARVVKQPPTPQRPEIREDMKKQTPPIRVPAPQIPGPAGFNPS